MEYNKRMKTTTLQLTEEQIQKLNEHKKKLRISKAGIIRIAIDRFFGEDLL